MSCVCHWLCQCPDATAIQHWQSQWHTIHPRNTGPQIRRANKNSPRIIAIRGLVDFWVNGRVFLPHRLVRLHSRLRGIVGAIRPRDDAIDVLERSRVPVAIPARWASAVGIAAAGISAAGVVARAVAGVPAVRRIAVEIAPVLLAATRTAPGARHEQSKNATEWSAMPAASVAAIAAWITTGIARSATVAGDSSISSSAIGAAIVGSVCASGRHAGRTAGRPTTVVAIRSHAARAAVAAR